MKSLKTLAAALIFTLCGVGTAFASYTFDFTAGSTGLLNTTSLTYGPIAGVGSITISAFGSQTYSTASVSFYRDHTDGLGICSPTPCPAGNESPSFDDHNVTNNPASNSPADAEVAMIDLTQLATGETATQITLFGHFENNHPVSVYEGTSAHQSWLGLTSLVSTSSTTSLGTASAGVFDTLTFTVAAGDKYLYLSGTNIGLTNALGFYLTNLTVGPVISPDAAPEPSSLAIIGLGLIGLVAVRARSNRLSRSV